MDGPPTLLSKARRGLRVAAPLAAGAVLFGTDLGKRLGISPERLWDGHVADHLDDDGPWHSLRSGRSRPHDHRAWLLAGATLAYTGLRDLKRHPVGTVGPARRVETDPLDGDGDGDGGGGADDARRGRHGDGDHPGRRDRTADSDGRRDGAGEDRDRRGAIPHCTVCGTAIDEGERRRYADQWVLFGIPLWNRDYGENDYCGECAVPRPEEGPVPEDGAVGAPDRNLGDDEVRRSDDGGRRGDDGGRVPDDRDGRPDRSGDGDRERARDPEFEREPSR